MLTQNLVARGGCRIPTYRPVHVSASPRSGFIASLFEVHYTPKHGSWLNMAEIESSVFEWGCPSRPVGDLSR